MVAFIYKFVQYRLGALLMYTFRRVLLLLFTCVSLTHTHTHTHTHTVHNSHTDGPVLVTSAALEGISVRLVRHFHFPRILGLAERLESIQRDQTNLQHSQHRFCMVCLKYSHCPLGCEAYIHSSPRCCRVQ